MTSLRVVGADERTRSVVRSMLQLVLGINATVAIARDRADWAQLNQLDGPVVVIVYDSLYADNEDGEWPIFHIEDIASVAAFLMNYHSIYPHPEFSESEEYMW
jgi:hypothetical protein